MATAGGWSRPEAVLPSSRSRASGPVAVWHAPARCGGEERRPMPRVAPPGLVPDAFTPPGGDLSPRAGAAVPAPSAGRMRVEHVARPSAGAPFGCARQLPALRSIRPRRGGPGCEPRTQAAYASRLAGLGLPVDAVRRAAGAPPAGRPADPCCATPPLGTVGWSASLGAWPRCPRVGGSSRALRPLGPGRRLSGGRRTLAGAQPAPDGDPA